MRYLSILVVFATLLISCGGGKPKTKRSNKKAKGTVEYGGVFRVNQVEDFRNLFPLNVTEVTSFQITNQVYEGLVKFDQKDLKIIAGLAEKWEINEDATKFTFHIRKGVKFHDDPCFPEGKGREVTVADVAYCFNKICESSSENQMFWIFKDKVKGANAYYQSTIDGKPLENKVEGIKIIDDSTIEVELDYPFAGFINIMGHMGAWIYPKEAWDAYGKDMRIKCVGTGPFKIKVVKEGQAVILERNPTYWKVDAYGNKLPYLDAIRFSFLKEKKSELLEFKKGNLDMVFKLPLEMIDDVLGELEDAKKGGNTPFQLQVTPALMTEYYGFQHASGIFQDANLRRAFAHAVDRENLVTYTLQGDGRPANFGIVPPGFKGYEYDSIKGLAFNPDLAREYLKKAGFPSGKGFPELTLQLNSGGSRNIQVAEAIQSMLKENLNIDIKMEVMPFAQHLENYETGKAQFWRTAWLADYPDPEIFLNLLYGKHVPKEISTKSYVNSIRYKSDKFDALFEQALRTPDKDERYDLYRQADQVALDDAAYLPVYYGEFTRLLQKNVRNFPANSMEFRDFTEVFFKE